MNRCVPPLAAVLLLSGLTAAPASGLDLQRDSLPNGLVVLSCEDHRLPICDIALVCRSGAAFDPPGRAGIAALTANLLTKGVPGMSADSVAAIVEFLGARLDAGADFDGSHLRLRVLAKDLEQGLDLLCRGFREPAFAPREFRLARDQALARVRRMYDYPQFVVSAAFDRLQFGSHPYAWPATGDTGTLHALSRDDLVRFHRRHYLPNNCFLVAVGDFDRRALLTAVRARLGDWSPGTVPQLAVPEVIEPAGIKARLITRPDMNQTYIELGHPGISVFQPDLMAARLMSYILGGSPLSSRLGLAVREKAGLAYDVRCWFDRMKLRGAFHATVQTAQPRLALELMLGEIRLMRDSGVNAAELLKAHEFYTGSFPLTYSSNRGKLDQITTMETYRFGIDWFDRYPDRVRAVTLDGIHAAARDYLRPDDCYLVIMGPVTRDQIELPGIHWLD